MDEPVKQAALVLSETDSSWTEERINEVVKSGVRTVVRLKEPMPVHIMYQTAWGDKDGVIHFVRDIYGRDKKLEQVLY
jgi:murein L,D-transpeptidase YcbB/YkuD